MVSFFYVQEHQNCGPVTVYGALYMAFTILCCFLNGESACRSSIQTLFIQKKDIIMNFILFTSYSAHFLFFFVPTRTAASLMHGHILGDGRVAKCAIRANAISRAGWTALKGTSGWKVSLLLQSLKQWRITAVAFGWRWFSMELDGLYRMQLGPVWQSYSSC